MLLKMVVFSLLLLAVIALLMILAVIRWRRHTGRMRAGLAVLCCNASSAVYGADEIEGLPPPVRRYFRAVLTEGQPLLSRARFAQTGLFNMGDTQARWCRFSASQFVTMQRPGFDWDARIVLAPGLKAFVHDAYVAGEGVLHASLLGLITVAQQRGTREMAQGELMRFLAEAAWYPTALLPSQGVRWDAIDDSSALATLSDAAISVSLVFHFDAEGLISEVHATSRHRMVNGENIPTPWYGRFSNYAVRAGMRIPLEGEVAWGLPDGEWPYWRGRITDISYD